MFLGVNVFGLWKHTSNHLLKASLLMKDYLSSRFDYGDKFWIIKWKQFTCECGSPRCRYSTESIHKTIEEYNKRLEEDETSSEVF